MLTARELVAALYGTLRLVRLKPDGFRWFDASLDGFWRSFAAAALVAPLYVFSQLVESNSLPAGALVEANHPARTVLLEAIAYVVGWVAYPLLMVSVTRIIDRERQFFRYMVAYNWFQVPKELLFFILTVAYLLGGLPREGLQFLALVAVCGVLFYFWFIAKTGLEVDGYTAAGLVLIDLTVSLVISGVASRA